MAYKFYGNMRFLPRSDTFENWEAQNPVLGAGEWGAVIGVNEVGDLLDTVQRMKVGDGITPWNDLPWWNGPQGPQGEKGDTGEQGPQGIQGPKGEAGVIKFIVVNSLPQEDIENAIYLLPANGGSGPNLYDEYIYIDGRWECLGSAGIEVNLDEYVKKEYVDGNFVKYKETSGVMRVYGNDSTGAQKLFTLRAAGQAVKGSHIPQTDTNGVLHAMTPTAEAENTALITKEYAEGNFLPLNTKTAVVDRLYGIDTGGNQKIFGVAKTFAANAIPLCDNTGRLSSASPSQSYNVATKGYVDDNFLPLNTTTNEHWNRVYAVDTKGNQISLIAGVGQGANKIVVTDGYGNINISEPKNKGNATTKNYVDNAISNGLTALAIPNVITDCGKSLIVNDVSPLAHKCSLQLTSDTYEEVVGGSKNVLVPNPDNFVPFEIEAYMRENGTIDVIGYSFNPPSSFIFILDDLIPNQTYTFSIKSGDNEVLCLSNVSMMFEPYLDEDKYEMDINNMVSIDGTDTITFVWKEEFKSAHLTVGSWGIMEGENPYGVTLYPQLNLGDTPEDEWTQYAQGKTETKPYIDNFTRVTVYINGTEYAPSPEGLLEGIESVYPKMEITFGGILAEYVNIKEFTYCADTKKYIDNKFAELKAELQGG